MSSTILLLPRAQLCNRSCSNKHTHANSFVIGPAVIKHTPRIHSHWHTPPRTRSPSSRHPLFTHYPFPPRSLVCGGHPSPHKPRFVVSHNTCPPLFFSPHAHSFAIGPAVINTHTSTDPAPSTSLQAATTDRLPRSDQTQ